MIGRHARDEHDRGAQLNSNSRIPRLKSETLQQSKPGPSNGGGSFADGSHISRQKATAAKSISADRAISGAGRPADRPAAARRRKKVRVARERNKPRIVYALLNGTLPSRVIESSGTRHDGDRCTGPPPLSRLPLKQHPRTWVG